jgi:hypothetical protein
VAQQPVIVLRHDDGGIRVLRNRCGHRGAQVVTQRCGRAALLRCPYHGWTFRTDGTLDAIPVAEGYDASFERAAHGMAALPRVGSYRGFVFASLAADGPSLEDFLGEARGALDNMVERAPDGALEIAGGSFRAIQRNNWKIYLENLHDGLHAQVVHAASIAASRAVAASDGPSFALEVVAANGTALREMAALQVNCYPRGHSDMRGFRKTRAAEPEFAEYETALARRLGADGAARVLADNRHNALVYPGLLGPSRVPAAQGHHPGARRPHDHRGLVPAHERRAAADASADGRVRQRRAFAGVDRQGRRPRGLRTRAAGARRWAGLGEPASRPGARRRPATALDERFIRNQYAAWRDYMEAA